MQVEVILSGIGGQGVQLAAKTLAMAATAEGRQVLMSAHYGGEMRGGQTEASVIVSEGALRAVPILESSWSAYVMHPRYWPGVNDRLRPGGPVVVNTSVPGELEGSDRGNLFEIPAGDIAARIGAELAAGFVLLGAYAQVTSLVGVESLVEAMKELVPPYRAQHVAANEAAIRAGAAAAGAWASAAPAWGAAA